ncbi:MAG TPA: RraA family protein [Chloroflexota bacterium]
MGTADLENAPATIDFEVMRKELYTGVICDVMDGFGLRDQSMTADIRPVHPEMVIAGRARTALSVDVYYVHAQSLEQEIEFVDGLRRDDVAVACTNRSTRTGFWGELLSTAARARGGRGAVMDGYVRDVRRIVEMGFPVFAAGMRPVDSRGRSIVLERDVPVECGGVLVTPGDVIFADIDGVVVIPERVAAAVVSEALERVRKEDATRAELEQGALLREVYAKFGVL